jgi:hypothetical protein
MREGLEQYLDVLEREILEQCLSRYPGTLDEMARDLEYLAPRFIGD